MSIRLGPKETEVVARLSYEKTTAITKEQLEKLFGRSVLVRQIIYQLKRKGILKPITRGVYYYSPLEAGPAGAQINEFLIPPILFPKGNYYVGYSNMYNYYGFTDQLFQTFYVLNTSRQRERTICGIPFRLVKISPKRIYGLENIKISSSQVIVSDRERTLVDLIYFPDPVGGLKKAFEILEEEVSSGKSDIKKLIEYAVSFPAVSTRKRIGFVLDKCGISKKILAPLEKSVKNTSLITLCGSKSRKGTIDNKWKVIIDAS
ncbi:MAG: type IV toxin-antitoxin system AbiEi family antitoxin domain-containing protein [Planctomycetota bacterium]|jgi:predicted transcriptional regulator of viral defense system